MDLNSEPFPIEAPLLLTEHQTPIQKYLHHQDGHKRDTFRRTNVHLDEAMPFYVVERTAAVCLHQAQ